MSGTGGSGTGGPTVLHDLRGCIVMPGFVDTHVHYPQTDIIAAHGTALLDWLQRYTFPAEARFADVGHARARAAFFLDELLRNGTTSAMVFCTVHPQSADALFEAAAVRGMRLVAGKVLMDRHAPAELLDTTQQSHDASLALIRRWHGQGRLTYAVTPRFAPTSSEAGLEVCRALLNSAPELMLQTHVAENRDEVAWVAQLFPSARSYLDVYDRFGLLGPRSVLAHCLYLDDIDRARMAEAQAVMAFCPTSNLFLGSGLFDMQAADHHGGRVALATDVGAGTSLSMLRTMGEAYKVARLRGQQIAPWRLLYLATLAGARALGQGHRIGSLEAGKEADLVVLDPRASALSAARMETAESIEDVVFALTMLADDRHVAGTYVGGCPVLPSAASTAAVGDRPP